MSTTTELILSGHAVKRMSQRGLQPFQIDLVLQYGRKVHARRAVFYVIGRKEVEMHRNHVPELEKLEGIQIVVNANHDVILTVYRNHDLRGIRPCKRRHRKLG